MKIIKPPSSICSARFPKIFLAGSIENNAAENWQAELEEEFKYKDITIYNPRRDEWDSSWEQNINNNQFYEQVNWELQALEDCDYILMYFDPNTKSPITLLELGLFAKSGKIAVCCPDGFWRKGNVEIVCKKFNIPLYTELYSLVNNIDIMFRPLANV